MDQTFNPSTCEKCGDTANVSIKRYATREGTHVQYWTSLCYDCFYAYQDTERAAAQLKNLAQLVGALREHAYRYTFQDGHLVADLRQAANYLEAVSNA